MMCVNNLKRWKFPILGLTVWLYRRSNKIS